MTWRNIKVFTFFYWSDGLPHRSIITSTAFSQLVRCIYVLFSDLISIIIHNLCIQTKVSSCTIEIRSYAVLPGFSFPQMVNNGQADRASSYRRLYVVSAMIPNPIFEVTSSIAGIRYSESCIRNCGPDASAVSKSIGPSYTSYGQRTSAMNRA